MHPYSSYNDMMNLSLFLESVQHNNMDIDPLSPKKNGSDNYVATFRLDTETGDYILIDSRS